MRDKQYDIISDLIRKLPDLDRIILAVDNGKAGHKIASKLEEIITASDFDPEHICRHTPAEKGEDWNDVLRAGV